MGCDMQRVEPRRRAGARSDQKSLGDPRRRRRARCVAAQRWRRRVSSAAACRFRSLIPPTSTIFSPALAPGRRICRSPATPTSCRRATLRLGRSLRRRDFGGRAFRPRRRRHEGRHRRLRRRRSRHLQGGNPLRGRCRFLITGDEEGPAIHGTVKLLRWMAEHGDSFDHCLVGEPTNAGRTRRHDQDRPARLAQRPDRCIGEQGHVAYPQRADNPVRPVVALARH